MSQHNVSGFGTKVTIVSTTTFPYGFTISQLSDDVDPVSIENLEVAKHQMLLNGDLLTYKTANPAIVDVSVIPGSSDDANLSVILSASRIKQQIVPIPDIVVMTIAYPDGAVSVLAKGSIISGPPARSVMASGRAKSNKYRFAFGEVVTVGQSGASTLASIGTIIL